MYKIKTIVSCIAVCALTVFLYSCGNKNKSEEYASMYETTIAGLQDDELFAIVETNASSPVLLVTSQYYDDGSGNQASIYCDVYYATGKEVKKTGTIESLGTAYPVAYDNTGIYAASGHGMQRFEIDEKTGAVVLAETIYEQFDEEGNASYTLEKVGETEMLTEEEYYEAFKKYREAAVVNFTYGASGT